MDKKNIEVIVGTTYWTLNGVNVFAENLVRDLRAKGISAHILLTEEDSVLIKVTEAWMQRPDDIPFVELPVKRQHSWGAHWGAMIRYLEERVPCIYIPNSDWRHSCVCPLLSKDVGIVGVVHSDDPLHYDHVARLGKYWNAITTTSTTITKKTIALDPTLQDRLVTIPIGVDIPVKHTKRARSSNEPLKLIYHGTLKQYQKRILDFPKIISKAVQSGVPVKLTMAGGGPDEEELRKVSQKFVEQGLIRFPGVVPRDKIFDLLESHDVYILTSEFEGMPNALLEAMGRGCVPLVTKMESAVPDLVQNDYNGFVVPIGDIDAFVQRLWQLYQYPDQCLEMSLKAYETVSNGKFRIQDMVDAYTRVFDRVVKETQSGIYKRPPGVLEHPPAQVAGENIFPVELLHKEKGIGRFPTLFRDYRAFKKQIQQTKLPGKSPLSHLVQSDMRRYGADLARLKDVTVIVTAPVWTSNGINDFSATLVRKLRANGISAHILLTEEETGLVEISEPRMPHPSDVPFEYLPVERTASWGAHWGAMIRYLEERVPCIYIPNHDWRHSCVSPLLSNRVAIIGVAHGDDPLHYDHVQRLGRYWNAIVAFDPIVAQNIHALDPSLTSRIVVISPESDEMIQSYLEMFDQVVDEAYRGVFHRPKGLLQPPPAKVAEISIFPVELEHEEQDIGWFPTRDQDYRAFKQGIRQIPTVEASPLAFLVKRLNLTRLKDMTVIVAAPVWTSNGVNDFSATLVRKLRANGLSAHILLTEEETELVEIPEPRMPHPSDVPFEYLPVERTVSWGGHWGAMIRYLEERAPCIYIPNHDWRHSCVSPLLSARVAVVGVVHGDDPLHYDHVQRLGRYWNAIVAIDNTVARKIQALDSSLSSRIVIIPHDIGDMVQDYLDLFEQVFDEAYHDVFRRPTGVLQPPPAQVAGVDIFPVELSHNEEGIGRFLTVFPDYREFQDQIQQLQVSEQSPLVHLAKQNTRCYGSDLSNLSEVTIVAASPVWTYTGVNEFSANLVRELKAKGISAHILLTEEETDLVDLNEVRMPRPPDVPFEQLPVERIESWGGHWGAMIRYLEERAPCIYIPNYDWRHSCVSPLLSDRVAIVGVVHGDDPLHYDHVQRLGRYWNAIVAIDNTVAQKIQALDSSLTSRIVIIPHNTDDMIQNYLEFFNRVSDEAHRGIFRRPKGILQPPPAYVAGVNIFPVELFYNKRGIGRFPTRDPDYIQFKSHTRSLWITRLFRRI